MRPPRLGPAILVSVVALSSPSLLGNEQHSETRQGAQYPGAKLFSIPYGSGADQVGLDPADGFATQGPGQLKVDSAGNIWLLDRVNCQVKAFRRDGTVLRAVGRVPRPKDRPRDEIWAPLERIDMIRIYTADRTGRICLLADSPLTHLFVIDRANTLVESERDVYGNLVRIRGEEKILQELRERLPALEIRSIDGLPVRQIHIDDAGNLYLLGNAAVQSRETLRTETSIYKFDQDLECVGTVPGYYVGPDGYTYEFAEDNTLQNVRIHTYDREGSRVGTCRLVRPEGPWDASARPMFDWSHNIYLPCFSMKTVPAAVMPGVEINYDYDVYKYSLEGDLLWTLTIPGTPLLESYNPSPIAVDKDENVYYLIFGPTELHVMMVSSRRPPGDESTP